MERSEDTDDHVRGLIRGHMAANGAAAPWAAVYEAAAELGYSAAEVQALAQPILAARGSMAAGSLVDGDFAPIVRKAAPASSQPPASVAPRKLATHVERLQQIDADVAKIRAYALVPDETQEDGTRIKFPNTYLAAVHHQLKAVEVAIKVGEALYDLDRVSAYFNRLAEIIRDRLADHPDLQDLILADLDALNANFMNLGAHGD